VTRARDIHTNRRVHDLALRTNEAPRTQTRPPPETDPHTLSPITARTRHTPTIASVIASVTDARVATQIANATSVTATAHAATISYLYSKGRILKFG